MKGEGVLFATTLEVAQHDTNVFDNEIKRHPVLDASRDDHVCKLHRLFDQGSRVSLVRHVFGAQMQRRSLTG